MADKIDAAIKKREDEGKAITEEASGPVAVRDPNRGVRVKTDAQKS